MSKYLTEKEVQALIAQVRGEDENACEKAWEALHRNYENYVHDLCWKRIAEFDFRHPEQARDLEAELFQAGEVGFVDALRHYQGGKAKFVTFATKYIKGAISKELSIQLNSMGLGHLEPRNAGHTLSDAPDKGKYKDSRRALQILEIWRLLSDDEHPMTVEELKRYLKLYRRAKHQNGVGLEADNSISTTIREILREVNPAQYAPDKDTDYLVKYSGYQENALSKKGSTISNFAYQHPFTNAELDDLIQVISLSGILSPQDKSALIGKLCGTASVYYKNPWYDGGQLRFDPKGISGRRSKRRVEKNDLPANLKTLQYAIRHLYQVRFLFNRYTEDHKLVPKQEFRHELSPYHLVVYQDNYFCIGLKHDGNQIWHYRVDLMTEVELVRDADGNPVPIRVKPFEGLPILSSRWDPEEYLAEHLYMGYDEPREILIRVKPEMYTALQSWFGDHFEKRSGAGALGSGTAGSGTLGSDTVCVRTSPNMMVHWAMQYGTSVEVLDEEIRRKIREELKSMRGMYGERNHA